MGGYERETGFKKDLIFDRRRVEVDPEKEEEDAFRIGIFHVDFGAIPVCKFAYFFGKAALRLCGDVILEIKYVDTQSILVLSKPSKQYRSSLWHF